MHLQTFANFFINNYKKSCTKGAISISHRLTTISQIIAIHLSIPVYVLYFFADVIYCIYENHMDILDISTLIFNYIRTCSLQSCENSVCNFFRNSQNRRVTIFYRFWYQCYTEYGCMELMLFR